MLELVPAKSILARNKDPRWFGIDYQMNLYRGCCHGCIYCDSRSECYGIEEFDRVRGKKNALALLEEELRHKRKTGVAATGAMSDPYNPYESEAELTRGGLKLLDQYGFGAAVATKSARITRDLDVLKRIQSHSPVLCKITVTTCDDELCRKLEPYPSVTSERMEAVRILSGAGIFTGLLLMPVLPFLEDSLDNLLGIVRQFRNHEQPSCTAYTPSAEVMRLDNAINRGLEQPDSPEAVMALILQGAAARYACCPEPSAESEPSDSLTEADWRRFQRAVSHITISQDTEVTLIFTDKKATGKDE